MLKIPTNAVEVIQFIAGKMQETDDEDEEDDDDDE